MNATIEFLIEQYGTYTDRLDNPVSEDRALALIVCLSEAPEGESRHRLTAFTRPNQLESLGNALAEKAVQQGEQITPAEAVSALKSIITDLQIRDDDWGTLSPYLEELIAAEHPNVRLKTPGKYNAEGRHKVLLRTHPGEGGWKPASAIPSRDAEKIWKAAGLDYPKNLKGATDDQLAQHAGRYENESLSFAVSRRRRLRLKIQDIQLELEALTPVIRKENLEDTQRRLPEIAEVYHQAEAVVDELKAQKHMIEACLSAISADQEVDPHDPEFRIFSRAFNLIERDIGRFNTAESVTKDQERIAQAAAITRSLIASLPNDSVGIPLKNTLKAHLENMTIA